MTREAFPPHLRDDYEGDTTMYVTEFVIKVLKDGLKQNEEENNF